MYIPLENKKGFTLVEIMIFVLVIGILAAMAHPAFQKVKTHSMASRVASDFRTYAGLFETYTLDNGTYPADSSPGALPSGMEDYINIENWSERTPIGGSYDWVFNGFSGTPVAAISITGYTAGDDPVKKLYEIMDDAGLSTGIIQKSGASVIYIIE